MTSWVTLSRASPRNPFRSPGRIQPGRRPARTAADGAVGYSARAGTDAAPVRARTSWRVRSASARHHASVPRCSATSR